MLKELVKQYKTNNVNEALKSAEMLRDKDELVREFVSDPDVTLLSTGYSCQKTYSTYYYQYKDSNFVLGVTYSTETGRVEMPFIVDKDFYDGNLSKKYVQAHMSGAGVLYPQYYINGAKHKLYRDIVSTPDGMECDHTLCCSWINVKLCLRNCTKTQNTINKVSDLNGVCRDRWGRYYFKITKIAALKAIPGAYAWLESHGFDTKKPNPTSQHFNNADDMYALLNEFEDTIYGEYRYNPLLDLKDDFYLAVIWLMMGLFTEEDVKEFRRQELLHNGNKALIKYYGIELK